MKTGPRPLLLAALASLCAPFSIGAERTWTDTKGRSIDGELIEASDTQVTLKRSDHRVFEIPLKTLSKPDRGFVAEWIEKQALAEIRNWDDPWPSLVTTDVTPEIEVIKEEAPDFIYASPHYEFHCDVRLSTSVVRRFAVLFEATNQYVRELPLAMAKAHQEKRHKIKLFETEQAYISAGAPSGSAGVYMGGEDIIMVPLTSLGVKKVGSGYMLDYDEGNKTLPHEIVHQLTDQIYYQAGPRGWFTEGFAEYVALTPYRSGKFRVSVVLDYLREYVTAYGKDGNGGRAIGDEIHMPDIKDWMLQPYSAFTGQNSRVNYGMGALVTYYFFHMDGEEEAERAKEMLKAMKAGKTGEEALEVLLDGRTWDELEEEITTAWRARGVRIHWD